MLVPIEQVGPKWVRPFDAKKFTVEFTFDPTKLANVTPDVPPKSVTPSKGLAEYVRTTVGLADTRVV